MQGIFRSPIVQVPEPLTTFYLSNGTEVTFPSTVTEIDKSMVEPYRETITSVFLSSTIERVSDGTFEDCASLSSVTIAPLSCFFGDNRHAFSFCQNLTDIYYKGTKEDWMNSIQYCYDISETGDQSPWCNRNGGGCTIHCTDGDATVTFIEW